MKRTIISRNIKTLENLNSIYVYALIKKYANTKTHISTLSENMISKLTDLSLKSVKKIISTFKKTDLFEEIIIGHNTYNKYVFRHSEKLYIEILDEFFTMPLKGIKDSIKAKGFLIALKAITIMNTNKVKYTQEEIAKALGLSKPTVNKFINLLMESGDLKKIKNGYLITNQYIVASYIDNTEETKVYNEIYNVCINRNIVPVERNNRTLLNIIGSGNYNADDLKKDFRHLNYVQVKCTRHKIKRVELPEVIFTL